MASIDPETNQQGTNLEEVEQESEKQSQNPNPGEKQTVKIEIKEKQIEIPNNNINNNEKNQADNQQNNEENKKQFIDDIIDKQNSSQKTFFGIPMSPINPRYVPWEKNEKVLLIFPFSFLTIGLIMELLVSTEAIEFKDSKYILDLPGFHIILQIIATVLVYWFLMIIPGMLVFYQKVPVEVTRKVVHILIHLPMFFISRNLDEDYDVSSLYWKDLYQACIWANFSYNTSQCISYIRPMRKINKLAYWSFHCFDRPSDRPNTLLWIAIQNITVNITYGPYVIWAEYNDYKMLKVIPFFCSGLGDGLAEPIGRLIGKHKYKTTGLFSKHLYSRSWEGSFCVYLMTFIGVVLSYPDLDTWQFIFLLIVLPLVQTIVEAKAPHTLDNGFMIAICFLIVWFTKEVV